MAAAAPYILLAAGTAAQMQGARQQQKERQDTLNQAFQRNDKTQDNASKMVEAEGQNYGQKRLADVQTQEQSAMAQALNDIGAKDQTGAGAAIIDTAGDQGAVSNDFLKAKADRAVTEGTRLTDIARELSKIRAPGQVANAAGLRRADLVSQLGSDASSNRAFADAAGLDAQGIGMPGYGQLGSIASSVGSTWAGSNISKNGGFGAAPASTGYTAPRIPFYTANPRQG